MIEDQKQNQIQYNIQREFNVKNMVDMYAYLQKCEHFLNIIDDDKKLSNKLDEGILFYEVLGRKIPYGKQHGKTYDRIRFFGNLFISGVLVSSRFQDFIYTNKKSELITGIFKFIKRKIPDCFTDTINDLISQVLIEIFPTLNDTELESLFNDFLKNNNQLTISQYDSISTIPIKEIISSMKIISEYLKPEWKFKFNTKYTERKFLPTISDLKRITITIQKDKNPFNESKHLDQDQYVNALILTRNLLLVQHIFDTEDIYENLKYKPELKKNKKNTTYDNKEIIFDKKKYLDNNNKHKSSELYYKHHQIFKNSYSLNIKQIERCVKLEEIKDYQDILIIIKFAPHDNTKSYDIIECNTDSVTKKIEPLIEHKNNTAVKENTKSEVEKEINTENQNVTEVDNNDKENTDPHVNDQKSDKQTPKQSLITTKNFIICVLLVSSIVLSYKKITKTT